MRFRHTDPYHEYLRTIPLFARLTDRDLEHVARAATDLRFRPGDVIVREGAFARETMFLTSGTAEVTRGGTHVADVTSGASIGELGVLTDGSRNATVTCTSEAHAIHFTATAFLGLLRQVPSIAPRMLPSLAARAA